MEGLGAPSKAQATGECELLVAAGVAKSRDAARKSACATPSRVMDEMGLGLSCNFAG